MSDNPEPHWDQRDKNLGPGARARRPSLTVEVERTLTDPELIELLLDAMFAEAVVVAREVEGDSLQWFNQISPAVMAQVGDRLRERADNSGQVFPPYQRAEQDRLL